LGRHLCVVLGTFFLLLGLVGVVVPLLPSTPLLLLAAACYARGSRRFYSWLVESPLLGRYIRDYREQRAMTRRAKATVLTLLWLVIGYSALATVPAWWAQALLLLVAVAVTVHVVLLRRPRR